MDDELPKGFHWLTVSDVRRETAQATSVAFHIPDELKAIFGFSPGQYLTLLRPGQEPIRRPYSICSAHEDEDIRVCVKHLSGGAMSTFVNTQLKIGDRLPVRRPTGRFCLPEGAPNGHYVFIAAGSGITPILAHVRALLRDEGTSATLIYGNSTRADIIFREELLDLKNANLGRLALHHVLSREHMDVPLFEGRLEKEKITQLVTALTNPAQVSAFLICGPGPVMDNAESALRDLGVEDERVLTESFGSHIPVQAPPIPDELHKEPSAKATITINGEKTSLDVPYDKAVLDVALAAGLDIPFACKGGVCCTCKARLVDGDVVMPVNYGLEADEIDRGFILTCQAIPRSKELVVDYDAV